ncbi:MAG: DNA polymerase III subunit gamma/tau [Paludibacteraceae bacterium]|nr:DNA polymerase III subunit gamma/tau [Paludibacteraceae bacterium]
MPEQQYIVSALKYRPTSWHTVVGQHTITDTLRNAIRTNRLAHAYLFSGPRGVGKTTCARIFAKTINCLNLTPETEACNECESCRNFNEQRSFNIYELDAASNNSVDDIRKLMEQVAIPPQNGRYKVFIIDEVHMLSTAAFNAFLKTLEEPPSYVIFILATTEKEKLLPTIISRCQVYDFQRITTADTIRHLMYVAEKEGISTTEEAMNVIAQKADGGMRDALSIFDQLVSYCGNTISYEQAIDILNVLSTDYYFRLVTILLQHDIQQVLLLFNEVLNKGFDALNFLVGFTVHLRNLLVTQNPATQRLLETTEAIQAHYAEQAKTTPSKFIFNALTLLNEAAYQYKDSKNKRLFTEITLIRLAYLNQPQAQPAQQPQAQQPQQPAQQPQVQQPAQQPAQQPTQQRFAPQSAPVQQTKVVTGLRTVSINQNAVSTQATPNSVSTAPQNSTTTETRNKSFNKADLEQVWLALPQQFQGKDRLKAALINSEKEISDRTITLFLSNPMQEEIVRNEHATIQKFLREKLENDNIVFKTSVKVSVERPSLMSVEERLNNLTERNPALKTLISTLQLELQ